MIRSAPDLLDKEEFKALTASSDTKAFRDLCIRTLLSLLLIVGFIEGYSIHPIIGVICWYLYSVQLHFWGYAGLGHEVFHRKVFSNKKLNQWLFYWCSAITWNNSRFFAKSHLYHHSNTFEDDDFEATSETSWRLFDILLYLLIDVRGMVRRIRYTLLNAAGYYPDGTLIKDKEITHSAHRTLALNLLILIVVYGITQSVLLTLAMGLAPFTGSLLNKVLAKSQHHGLASESENGPLYHSRTIPLPKFLSFLYANMNYHAEHHLVPSVPYYNLPDLHMALHQQGAIQTISLHEFLRNWVSGKYEGQEAKDL